MSFRRGGYLALRIPDLTTHVLIAAKYGVMDFVLKAAMVRRYLDRVVNSLAKVEKKKDEIQTGISEALSLRSPARVVYTSV